MLILTRKIGERVRVAAPCGTMIWLTMGDRTVMVHAPHLPVGDLADGGAKIFMPNGDTIIAKWFDKTIHSESRTKLNLHGMGILAPSGYDITREELL